jgi:hypothetical protein
VFFWKLKKLNFLTYSWRTRADALRVFFSKLKKRPPPERSPERSCRGCPFVGEELVEEENGEEVTGKEVA